MRDEIVNLTMENVYKSFPKIENNQIINVLDNINLKMKNNEFICIVGESGCGKSTILRLIAGLITPTQGKVIVNGKVVEGPSPNRGMVFQKPTLFPWLTVEENINFSLKMQKIKDKEKVHRMIDLIGLNNFKDDYPGQLSGGMAQRVALVRTLINNPQILLLDEPLGALDAFTRNNMQDEILNIWQSGHQLVVMVTHDVEEAIYMGTKVLVMKSEPGRIDQEIDIDMDYPRDKGSKEFLSYRNRVLDILNKKTI